MSRARGSIRGLFNPSQVSAVSAWYRFGSGTVTGSGYSSVPDVLGGGEAVQETDARRPVAGASANGLPIASFSDDVLAVPMAASTTATAPGGGFAVWVRCTSDGTPRRIWSVRGATGASISRVEIVYDTNASRGLHVDVFRTNTDGRRGASLALLPTNAWAFLTWEYDSALATDALKCLLTLNGSVLPLTFSTLSSDTDMPSLNQPSGTGLLGAATVTATFPYVGSFGSNVYYLNRHLTSAERVLLMNFEAPT